MPRRALNLAVFGVGATLLCATACSGSSSGPQPSSTPKPRPAPPHVSAPAATRSQAAPMLRPADLGPTWRYGTSPGVTRHSPATKPTNGSTLVVGTILGNSRWNGTAWAVTQTVTETATEFRSATDARNAIRLIVSSTDICHCVPKPAHVGGLLVWNRPAPTSLQAQFYVLSGRTEYYVSVAASSGTAQDAKQIYQTAIRRIQAAG